MLFLAIFGKNVGLSVVHALAGAVHEKGLVERVGATPAFRAEGVVEPLISGLDEIDEPVVLVIDDLHELRSPDGLRWLEHTPDPGAAEGARRAVEPQGPGARLHCLRLTADLVEIRGDDPSRPMISLSDGESRATAPGRHRRDHHRELPRQKCCASSSPRSTGTHARLRGPASTRPA